jgi:hypothetical protein
MKMITTAKIVRFLDLISSPFPKFQKANMIGMKDVRLPSAGSYRTVRTVETISLLSDMSKNLVLLDNITIFGRVFVRIGNACCLACVYSYY